MSLFFSDKNIQEMSVETNNVDHLFDDNKEQHFAEEIAQWATKFKISMSA